MIKVKFEKYWCDYHRQSEEKTFSGLDELEEWIFSQMERNYSDTDSHVMSFPTPAKAQRIGESGPHSIDFSPTLNGPSIWIHYIENGSGIIFSDGKMTAGQKHWSQTVQDWLVHCDKRQHAPKFNFVE